MSHQINTDAYPLVCRGRLDKELAPEFLLDVAYRSEAREAKLLAKEEIRLAKIADREAKRAAGAAPRHSRAAIRRQIFVRLNPPEVATA